MLIKFNRILLAPAPGDVGTDVYSSNGVPHSFPGGFVTFVDPVGQAIDTDGSIPDKKKGMRVVERFDPKKEGKFIARPNGYGAAGGFVIPGKAADDEPYQLQEMGSMTIQIPREKSKLIDIGFFTDVTIDGERQRWVVHSRTPAFEAGNYRKQTVEVARDHYVVYV